MFTLSRSIARASVPVLLVAAAGLARPGAAYGATAGEPGEPVSVSAPACVRYEASWRYTFVTNGCDTAQRFTVRYRDGATPPCRTAAPGDTVTFPGYGVGGDEVLGVDLCSCETG
ncbi:alpha-amylase [Streptomyces sp. F63]|uniref:alpha-amylase n=1 Tax=Streptomyces sp. F63 TaxID=2824887 RepID=UPI001B36B49E|nr:alpha-amylase [Streptomyces sp. F63]MBQ0986530.1 alpha-amylase [Streptomyces sp. F63]